MNDLVRRRERLRHGWIVAGVVWLWSGVVLAVLDDRFLWVPLLAVLPVAGYGGAAWTCAWWWRLRHDRRGHPMLRAAVPLSMVHKHRWPPDWRDCLVPGALLVDESGWHWRPTVTSGSELVAISWSSADIVSVTWHEASRPGLPTVGYVRLALRSAAGVDLMVWEPERLGRFTIGVPRSLPLS